MQKIDIKVINNNINISRKAKVKKLDFEQLQLNELPSIDRQSPL